MRFDDRLATVLRQPITGDAIARIQYRQLLDLLGTCPGDVHASQIDSAYLRLDELSRRIGAAERAAMLREPSPRLRSSRLIAQLAEDEPAVAAAAIFSARLSDDQWLDLIPALPLRVRGYIRLRRGMGPRVETLLDRLGINDRGLPPMDVEAEIADVPDAPDLPAEVVQMPQAEVAAPPSPVEAQLAAQADEGIGAIVRRIESFRKARQLEDAEPGVSQAPRLPLEGLQDEARHSRTTAFDFATDGEGRIVWSDPAVAPMAVGLLLPARDREGPLQSDPALAAAFRLRQPIRAARIGINGAPAIAGEWQVDAAPRFDWPGGHFVGYCGRMRRPVLDELGEAPDTPVENEADRMRQILHELRTPINAIQGFAEVIQQQLFGPTPHEYRALAAAIASDSAHMLAGFDELDRLVKLDCGAVELDEGQCDLATVLATTVAQLEAYTSPRKSGFDVELRDDFLPVAMARTEAERLVWRLLATLAGAAMPGETLKLRSRCRDGAARVTIRLPASLASRDDERLFQAAAEGRPAALSAGMFGIGFALRLAAAEAKAAGGSLERKGDKLRLSIPSFTNSSMSHSGGGSVVLSGEDIA